MSKIARTVLMLLSGLMVAPSLIAGPLPGFSLAAQTTHFAFYTKGNRPVDASKSEAYVTRLEKLLGCTVTGRAEYYRYGSPEEIAAGTGTYAQGLTFAKAGQIHSTQDFHAHEIVHLVAGQLGDPGVFFQEGLAVALGNDAKWRGQAVDKVAKAYLHNSKLSELIKGFDRLDPEVAYPLAGSFVSRLVRVHGIESVAAFFRAAGAPGADREAAFAMAFGESMDQAAASWQRSL
jgi:hypothetical protein